MRRSIFLLLLLIPGVCFSRTDFVNYYNKPQNWNTKKVGEGTLIIKEKVVSNEKLILPKNIDILIVENGDLQTKGEFSLTGDPSNPTAFDPETIHDKKIKAVMTIITNLLLD